MKTRLAGWKKIHLIPAEQRWPAERQLRPAFRVMSGLLAFGSLSWSVSLFWRGETWIGANAALFGVACAWLAASGSPRRPDPGHAPASPRFRELADPSRPLRDDDTSKPGPSV